jgi:predicted metal-dependent phosphotriesterase family hydrolase
MTVWYAAGSATTLSVGRQCTEVVQLERVTVGTVVTTTGIYHAHSLRSNLTCVTAVLGAKGYGSSDVNGCLDKRWSGSVMHH